MTDLRNPSLALGSVAIHYPVAGKDTIPQRYIASTPDDRRFINQTTVDEIFHAAWSKNKFILKLIAENIDKCLVICDADVVISTEMIKRILNLSSKLSADDVLIGLAGRRVCLQVPANSEPPRIRAERNGSILGYCQFVMHDKFEAWKTDGDRAWGDAHDDWLVYSFFGEKKV